MSDEKTIDLSGEGKLPQADPDGLTFISKDEADVLMEEIKEGESNSENCAYEAYRCLEAFVGTLALVPKASKYLPHLARIARAALNDKSDILDELSRADARGRCRSQVEIDTDEEAEAAEAEAE